MPVPIDNKVFSSPAVGTELTVNFNRSGTDTASTKYFDLRCCKKFQIRSEKMFKITKINQNTLSTPIVSSSTNPSIKLDLNATGNFFQSIVFEAEETSGDFNVIALAGIDV